jgi:hypothetical protein
MKSFTPAQMALFVRVLRHADEVDTYLTTLEEIDAEEHKVDGRRCIRVYAEPADRSIADEEKCNEEHRAYHARREQEEIAAMDVKFAARREKIHRRIEAEIAKLSSKPDENLPSKVKELEGRIEENISRWRGVECYDIERVNRKRAELSWTCPNDGRAHEFMWQGQRYLRTYKGEVWRDAAEEEYDEYNYCEVPHAIPVLGEWCGLWTGYFIHRAPEPKL